MRELANSKDREFDAMKVEMERKIKDLEESLRRERENLEGNAKERE